MILNETTKLLLTGSNALLLLRLVDMRDTEMVIGCVLSEVFPDLKLDDMKSIARQSIEEALNNAIVSAANKVNSYKK